MLLSAYIDGQLSGRDQEKVEQLLKASTVHREAVEDLRRTKKVLGMLPARRVPRNFTISAEAVRQPSIPSFFSVLRYASIAAGLLLVVVLGIDFLPVFFLRSEASLAREAQPEMLVAEMPVSGEDEMPDIIFWGGPPLVGGFGMGGGGGDGGVPVGPQFYGIGGGAPEGAVPQVAIPEADIPLEEALPPLGEIEEAVPLEDLEEGSAADPAPESAEEEALEKAVPAEQGAAGIVDSGPILGLRPSDQRGQISPALGFEPELAQPRAPFPFRTAEIVLAALLAVLGIPAWLLSRRKRK